MYSRKLVQNYIEWGAWYEPFAKFIIIPPGVLMGPANLMKFDSYQYELGMRHIILHEYFHLIFDIMQRHGISSRGYENWSRTIRTRYGDPSDTVHEENMADNFALQYGFSW